VGLLRHLLRPKSTEVLQGATTALRYPRIIDFEEWRDLRLASRQFLEPWEPRWGDDDHLAASFRRRVAHYSKLVSTDQAYPFFIFDVTGSKLLGGITLSNLRRGVAQTATLGYWTGAAFAGHGVMTDALQTMMNFAANDLALHRLEAACLPANTPSIRLLTTAGFEREGFARSYLKINDQWEDHILWGRTLGAL
jgi:[ribosomal protein S5]-alanine N-acetyltransferase